MLPLKMSLRSVRAVSRADIQLAGLTVLCGVNGAGKSTIARVIEDAIETNLYFEDRHRNRILRDFVNDTLRKFGQCIVSLGIEDFDKEQLLAHSLGAHDFTPYDKALKWLDEISLLLMNIFSLKKWKNIKSSCREMSLLAEVLRVKVVTTQSVESALMEKVNAVRNSISATLNEAITHELFNYVELYSPVLWKGSVDIQEGGVSVFSYQDTKNCCHNRLISVKDVIYIQSPLVSAVRYDDGDLFLLGNFAPLHTQKVANSPISSDAIGTAFAKIMHGEVKLKKLPSGVQRWVYQREDKKEFPLQECATGLKSFSLLSTLYAYGCLNEETILIIDEPEAHLHPQWVVEYAKMIVKLVSECGVRILIASHNPDMINALQAFAVACRMEGTTHFYQAVPDGGSNSYDYKYIDRKMDVGRIFDGFNKVYPAIEKVSATLGRKA